MESSNPICGTLQLRKKYFQLVMYFLAITLQVATPTFAKRCCVHFFGYAGAFPRRKALAL